MSEERTVPRKLSADTADQRDRSNRNHQNCDRDVYRKQPVQRELRSTDPMAPGKLMPPVISPMRSRPQQAKPGLNRGMEIRFLGGHLIEQPAEIERHNSPNQFDMPEWSNDQLAKDWPIFLQLSEG